MVGIFLPTEANILPNHLDSDVLVNILEGIGSHIAIHEVIFDEFGSISDACLLWCNEAYKRIRVDPVAKHQSMVATYVDSHVALAYVEKAWNEGQAFQYFEIGPSSRRETFGVRVPTIVHWQRIGDLVVEFDADLREYKQFEVALGDQTSAASVSLVKQAVANERERIAHDLHDSVIQQLYATSLTLRVLAKSHIAHNEHEHGLSVEIAKISTKIESVITEIRNKILEVEELRSSPLRIQLEELLVSILSPSGAHFDLKINVTRLPQELVSHIRAVCIESASNAVRHGAATFVRVQVKQIAQTLHIIVTDNGTGVDPTKPLRNGLRNMENRAKSLGGTMTLEALQGGGTVLHWIVPSQGVPE